MEIDEHMKPRLKSIVTEIDKQKKSIKKFIKTELGW